MIKNLPIGEVVNLAGLVGYQEGQVVSRTLVQDEGVSLTLFAFPEGEGLTVHTTPADALVYVLDGEAVIEIDGEASVVGAGESIVMPSDVPHAVTAEQSFKMLLLIAK
jgi:quercetin dioxygenase-like cupin family protein